MSCSPCFAPKSALLVSVYVYVCDALQRGSLLSCSLFIYLLAPLVVRVLQRQLQLSPSRPSQHSVLETLLGGWEAVACEAHSGPRAVGFSPL